MRSWALALLRDDSVAPQITHRYPTKGPARRYQAALFLEKEGFNEVLKAAHIAERYDLAVMSTKGLSVTAARTLVEHLSKEGVRILVAHDFDKSGFSIIQTLQSDTRRYQFETRPDVIDLGLRLADVQAMGLEPEDVDYSDKKDPRENLRANGATEEECKFLVERQSYSGGWTGHRVELNAMSSDVFLTWLEGKFKEHGIEKVVPDDDLLAQAYRRAYRRAVLQKMIDEALKDLPGDDQIALPDDLREHIQAEFNEDQQQAWDDVIWGLAYQEVNEEGQS
jgi:hypothetical protein